MYSDATNLMVCDEKEVESAGVPGGLKVSIKSQVEHLVNLRAAQRLLYVVYEKGTENIETHAIRTNFWIPP